METAARKTMYVRHLEPEQVLTVEVKFTKGFKMRLALAKFLIKCAARVLGCGIEINESEAH